MAEKNGSETRRSLYQQVILDHNRHPRNFREMKDATHKAEAYNALCGDQFIVYVKMEPDTNRIVDASFTGNGCAISKSSASLMTTALVGKTKQEVESLFAGFHRMLTSDPNQPAPVENLGNLEAMCGVREYPVRVNCATLAWRAVLAALDKEDETGMNGGHA